MNSIKTKSLVAIGIIVIASTIAILLVSGNITEEDYRLRGAIFLIINELVFFGGITGADYYYAKRDLIIHNVGNWITLVFYIVSSAVLSTLHFMNIISSAKLFLILQILLIMLALVFIVLFNAASQYGYRTDNNVK